MNDSRRFPWLSGLLAAVVIAPFAQAELAKASCQGQTVLLNMDQTDLGDRMALLRVALRVGDRALPLAWARASASQSAPA